MIRATDYPAFSLGLHEEALKKDIPLDGTIELTSHCNLTCVHCYIRDNSKKDELSCGNVCRIIDEIVEAGCLWLLITGGEPLIRDDFFHIYEYAKRKGLILTLFTNGTLITEETALFLKRWRPFSVEITLYGATRDTYEAMTGVVGSYEACIRGIELLVGHGIPLSLKTVTTAINKHELPDMRTFAAARGLKFKYDPVINPRLDGSISPYDVRISEDEVIALDFADRERTREWIELYTKFGAPASAEHLFNCGAGMCNFHITSEGGLRVCGLVPEPSSDICGKSFMDGYRSFAGIREKKLTGGRTCAGCDRMIFCDNCPGISMLENKMAGGQPVEYHCRVAHRRAEYILKEVEYGEKEAIRQA